MLFFLFILGFTSNSDYWEVNDEQAKQHKNEIIQNFLVKLFQVKIGWIQDPYKQTSARNGLTKFFLPMNVNY